MQGIWNGDSESRTFLGEGYEQGIHDIVFQKVCSKKEINDCLIFNFSHLKNVFYMHGCFSCMYVCAPCAYRVCEGKKRGC